MISRESSLFVYKRTVEIFQLSAYNPFMRVPLHPAKSQITLANVLFALSDPTRLRIVKTISEHDKINCCAIPLELSKSTASRHFRVLREAGIIRMEPMGIICNNSLRREELEELFPGLLDSVLQAMEPPRPRARRAR
jgi:DNA-binding transcriptional ArsR family regulator